LRPPTVGHRGGLENRFGLLGPTRVQIPPPPPHRETAWLCGFSAILVVRRGDSPDGRFIVTLRRAGTARVHTCRACGPVEDLLDQAADYPGLRSLPASLGKLVAWRAEILARVREVAADVLGLAPGDVTDDASLPNDLGLEYLSQIELVIELEDTFGVRISDQTMDRLAAGTVGAVANYIAARV
jgi:acyl carrier protein